MILEYPIPTLCLWQCIFSVRTARPGKHFLIETEDGGGELEDGTGNNGESLTLNKSAGALRCFCLGGVGWWLISNCTNHASPSAIKIGEVRERENMDGG